MTTYEENQFLYGFTALEGKPVTCLYRPTARSKKWRIAFAVKSYSEAAWESAMAHVHSGEWHAFYFHEGYRYD